MNKKFFQALTLSALVFGIMMSEARSKNEHYNNRELNGSVANFERIWYKV